jgi:flagellar hook-basal body complex protein FliE
MTVEPLVPLLAPTGGMPDAPLADPAADTTPAGPHGAASFSGALNKAFGDASASLDRADIAERAFTAGRGGLQEMVLERAQADVALSLASAAASRASQALSTILGMQV